MTTVVISILSTTGDGHGRGLPVYTSAQAWEDAAPADLVAADQIWRGECYNDGVFSSSSTGVVGIGGSTSDATRYKELTAAAGNAFSDSATAQTNALRVNSAVGVTFRTTGVGATIGLSENYARISRLQVAMEGSHGRPAVDNYGGGPTGCIISGCILESTKSSAYSSYGRNMIVNSLIITRVAASSIAEMWSSTAAYNCTFVVPSDLTKASAAIYGSYGTITCKNCAFFGCSSVKSGAGAASFASCITEVASPPAGCTTLTYDTSAGSGFLGIADSTRDFRIGATSALINAGVTDSVNAGFDIVGTARPQGAAYDVGCWEYVSAAVANLNPFINRMSVMAPILAQ